MALFEEILNFSFKGDGETLDETLDHHKLLCVSIKRRTKILWNTYCAFGTNINEKSNWHHPKKQSLIFVVMASVSKWPRCLDLWF